MTLASMKRTKADIKAERDRYAEGPIGGEGDAYPYGLRLSLDDETLKKLGIKPAKVGGTFHLIASCEVCAVSIDESTTGGERSHMSLQITEMSLAPADAKSAASAFYGDDDDAGGL